MRLLTPRARGPSVWAYTSNFGGGMVAGDRTRLVATIDEGARCFIGTQASTKIYRNPSMRRCSHDFMGRVAHGALLVLAPDPVQCFAGSSYEQRQHFILAPTANLLLVDWMSAGRTACGERWNFRCYSSRNEIERDGQTILMDSLLLNSSHDALEGKFRGGPFNCFATVCLFGPQLAGLARDILDWSAAQPVSPQSSLLVAVSPRQEGAILRLAGTSTEEVGLAIHARIMLVRQLLEDDPWARKW